MTKKKRFKAVRAVLSFIVILIVLFAAYVIIKCGGDLSLVNIRRTIINITAGVRSVERFDYDSLGDSLYADLSGGLLIASGADIRVYSPSGAIIHTEKFRAEAPAISTASGRAVVYGVSDRELYVFDNEGLVFKTKTENDIVSATMSKSGQLAVCTREGGWNGAVTVYTEKGTAVYKWYCATGYPVVADVSDNGDNLAVIMLGSDGSEVVITELGNETEKSRIELGKELVFDLNFVSGNSVEILTEKMLAVYKMNGTEIGRYEFGEASLELYAMNSDDMTVLSLYDVVNGAASLVTVGKSAHEIGRIDMERGPEAIAVSGTKAAALYTDTAVIYRKDLSPEVTLVLSDSADTVLMREDGAALVAGPYSAEILEP